MKKLNIASRLLLGLGSLLVIGAYFLPLWEIKLWAPQYPEGLAIKIWHNNLSGDVDVINGLNHYIGMKHIKVEMFPEFKILAYVIAAFIAWGLFVAYKGTLRWLFFYCASIVLGGIVALYDFYRWGYDYGHNLDLTAPIQVPGMAYQPPVLGYKVLLNFTALSIPAAGGWIVVGLGVLAFILLILEWKVIKPKAMTLLFIPLLFTSCMKVMPKIDYGKDNCDYCKMTIMDNKFGASVVTNKNRIFKFDDMGCCRNYLKENSTELGTLYVTLYDQPGKLAESDKAVYVQGGNMNSPMGSGIAAFSGKEACQKMAGESGETCLTYAELK